MFSGPYPHLPFVGVEVNRARLKSGGQTHPKTKENQRNRKIHAEFLRDQLSHLNAWWGKQKKVREAGNLPELERIPLWIQIDPSKLNADFLRGMGFTIVSEEEDGFVLVAADDKTFVVSGQRLDDFRDKKPKKDTPASIYEIGQPETEDERIRRILPADLCDSWRNIKDKQAVIVDLSISCDLKQPSDFKPQKEDESDQKFDKRVSKREDQLIKQAEELDEVKRQREMQIESFVRSYNGDILECYDNCKEVDFFDSFTVRVSINGQGFKDIVRSFAYLFMVENLEEIAADEAGDLRDILLIQSAGNIRVRSKNPLCYGVENHLQSGHNYPDYVHQPSCRVSNPAQSFQALTVGSIGYADFYNGYQSAIAGKDKSSAFSRAGLSLWDSIKPEVVEVGGDLVKTDTKPVIVSLNTAVAPPLVQSTLYGQSAVGQHSAGTSFAAPRVSGLALQIQTALPNESALLYRALVANSARWPDWADNDADPMSVLQRIGYGRPDPERALGNDPCRVTLIVSNEQLCAREAKLFRVPVPAHLRAAESNYAIRIDITLSYSAMPRRTRQGYLQYLSCRLDWKCSGKGQREEAFRNDLFRTGDDDRANDGYFPWMLRNDQYGVIEKARRNHGTLQKDWAVVESHELPEDFFVGVVGHPGWDTSNQYPANFALVVSFEAINNDVKIYEDVRVLIDQLRVQEQVQVTV